MNHIGEAIKMVRTSFNLKQYDIAERCGISRSHISQIEQGDRDPSWKTLVSICAALGIDVSIITMLMESNTPFVKPLAPLAFSHLLERAKEETRKVNH